MPKTNSLIVTLLAIAAALAMTACASPEIANTPTHLQAIAVYDGADQRFWEYSTPELVAKTLLDRGVYLLQERDDPQAALVVFEELVRRFEHDLTPAVSECVGWALINMGMVWGKLNDTETQIALLEMAVQRAESDARRFEDNPLERKQVARALAIQGAALNQLGNYEAAIVAYDGLLQRVENDPAPVMRVHVAKALLGKGQAWERLDDDKSALAAYDDLVEHVGNDTTLEMCEWVTWALLYKGQALERQNDYESAIIAYDDLIQRVGDYATPGMRERAAWALTDKGQAWEQLDDNRAAIAAYDEVLQRFGNDTAPNVRSLVTLALLVKGKVLERLGDYSAAMAVYEDVIVRVSDDSTLNEHDLLDIARAQQEALKEAQALKSE